MSVVVKHILTLLVITIVGFAIAYALLRIFTFVALAYVKTFSPDSAEAITWLNELNRRSVAYAATAADTGPKIVAWMLLAGFAAVTLYYYFNPS